MFLICSCSCLSSARSHPTRFSSHTRVVMGTVLSLCSCAHPVTSLDCVQSERGRCCRREQKMQSDVFALCRFVQYNRSICLGTHCTPSRVSATNKDSRISLQQPLASMEVAGTWPPAGAPIKVCREFYTLLRAIRIFACCSLSYWAGSGVLDFVRCSSPCSPSQRPGLCRGSIHKQATLKEETWGWRIASNGASL
jgi:hypothetical protein